MLREQKRQFMDPCIVTEPRPIPPVPQEPPVVPYPAVLEPDAVGTQVVSPVRNGAARRLCVPGKCGYCGNRRQQQDRAQEFSHDGIRNEQFTSSGK
ncbi:MAG: hypothetical protein K9G39_08435 [Chlorobium sp.]|uniref:hypothetical protein n=1 Tax=Chlorobium sp. TaxID=1095 RepID=UPI0025BF7E63|nr:hypothetical protein [Chlorobium sp.]MCF8383600.1 hypothetical protein [Chlorobium sp.]